MTSLFDFEGPELNLARSKTAGKELVAAKHEASRRIGAFLANAQDEEELNERLQHPEVERVLDEVVSSKMPTVTDPRAKLTKTLKEAWQRQADEGRAVNKFHEDKSKGYNTKDRERETESCVQKVKAKGYDEQTAIKICKDRNEPKGKSSYRDFWMSPVGRAINQELEKEASAWQRDKVAATCPRCGGSGENPDWEPGSLDINTKCPSCGGTGKTASQYTVKCGNCGKRFGFDSRNRICPNCGAEWPQAKASKTADAGYIGCPDCGATGVKRIPLENDWGEVDDWVEKECDYCAGTGEVDAITHSEMQAQYGPNFLYSERLAQDEHKKPTEQVLCANCSHAEAAHAGGESDICSIKGCNCPAFKRSEKAAKTAVRKRDLPAGSTLPEGGGPGAGVVMFCPNGDGEWSASRGDYWQLPDDYEFTCEVCGEPLELGKRRGGYDSWTASKGGDIPFSKAAQEIIPTERGFDVLAPFPSDKGNCLCGHSASAHWIGGEWPHGAGTFGPGCEKCDCPGYSPRLASQQQREKAERELAKEAQSPACSVCGQPRGFLGDPCMACVRARHKAVVNGGRCSCPKSMKKPRTVSNGNRTWVACDRCLGSIKQLSSKQAAEGDFRQAVVLNSDRTTLEQVQAALPANFTATQVEDGTIYIQGRDEAGWTLEGYVIPRLASGLIFAEEVTKQDLLDSGWGTTWASKQKTAEQSIDRRTGVPYYKDGDPQANWRVDVLAAGETRWATNALRFESVEDAKKSGSALAFNWLAVKEWRIVPASFPKNQPYDPSEGKAGTRDDYWWGEVYEEK